MKKITPAEAKELTKKPIIDDCLELGCGESIHIERTDWEYRSTPTNILKNHQTKTGMSFKVITLLKKKGWVITRIQ